MATRKMVRWRLENVALPSENIREPVMGSIAMVKVQSMCNLGLHKQRRGKDRWWEQHEKRNDNKPCPHHCATNPTVQF